MTLAWDAGSAPDLAGYRLYYGTASKEYSFTADAGMRTTYTITGLDEGVTYYFAATAYSIAAVESDFSSEIVHTVSSSTTTDIIWRNSASGLNAVWYMDGVTLSGVTMLTTVSDLNWKIAGR